MSVLSPHFDFVPHSNEQRGDMMEESLYVTIHIPESAHRGFFGGPIYQEMVQILLEHGAPGITVFRGYEGLDAKGHVQDLNSEYAQDSLPIILEMVVAQNQDFTNILQTVLKGHPHCINVTSVINVKETDPSQREVSTMNETAVLKIYMKEEDRYRGTPLYHALILRGRKSKFLWVNAQRALEGFGPDRVIRRERLFHQPHHAPVLVEITGTVHAIEEFIQNNYSLIASASGPAILVSARLVSGKA